jgi:hypothetical protein
VERVEESTNLLFSSRPFLWDDPDMGEDRERHRDDDLYRTGVNDHAWEREHRAPTTGQLRAIGYRRRDAEAKLEQHLREARHRNEEEKSVHDADDSEQPPSDNPYPI